MSGEKTRAEDLRDLELLHRFEVEGCSAASLVRQFGKSRASICGVVFRTSGVAARIPCACKKPENRDGGMPERWWV